MLFVKATLVLTVFCLVTGQQRSSQPHGLLPPLDYMAGIPNYPAAIPYKSGTYKGPFPLIEQRNRQLSPKVSEELPPIKKSEIILPPGFPPIWNIIRGLITMELPLFGQTYLRFRILEECEERIKSSIKTELSKESEIIGIPDMLTEFIRPQMKLVAEGIVNHISNEKEKAAAKLKAQITKWSAGLTAPWLKIVGIQKIEGTIVIQNIEENFLKNNTEKADEIKNDIVMTILSEQIKWDSDVQPGSKPFPWNP